MIKKVIAQIILFFTFALPKKFFSRIIKLGVSPQADVNTKNLNMAKEITGYVKLQCKGGQANPAPPIGPALGSKGINIMEFCKQFNARTQDKQGKVLPVLITVYGDKSFDFIIKTPPAAVQLKDAAKIQTVVKSLTGIRWAKFRGRRLKKLPKIKWQI